MPEMSLEHAGMKPQSENCYTTTHAAQHHVHVHVRVKVA